MTKATDNAELRRTLIQLKLPIGEAVPSAKHSRAKYQVFVSCNKCGGLHDTGISVVIEDGPLDKQSIGDLYNGKTLPKASQTLKTIASPVPRQGGNPHKKTTTKYF